MSKCMYVWIVMLMLGLTACGEQQTGQENVESTESVDTAEQEKAESENVIVETEINPTEEDKKEYLPEEIPEEAFDLSDLTPMEAMRKVMLGEAPFICDPYGTYYIDGDLIEQYRGYLTEYYSSDYELEEFMVKDMDGDDMPEIVIDVNPVGSEYPIAVVLLRYYDGKVYGYEHSLKGLWYIEESGMYHWSNSGFEYGRGKKYFIGTTIMTDSVFEYEGYGMAEYQYYHDVIVDEETMDRLSEEAKRPYVRWIDYTKEHIDTYVVNEAVPTDAAWYDNERQAYLDTLSDLIERKETDSKSYYYNCIAEMNAVYELYRDTLSGQALKQLEAEQAKWQEEIDKRLAIDLYHRGDAYSIETIDEEVHSSAKTNMYQKHGDMYLHRAFHLINHYYGCDFYD